MAKASKKTPLNIKPIKILLTARDIRVMAASRQAFVLQKWVYVINRYIQLNLQVKNLPDFNAISKPNTKQYLLWAQQHGNLIHNEVIAAHGLKSREALSYSELRFISTNQFTTFPAFLAKNLDRFDPKTVDRII